MGGARNLPLEEFAPAKVNLTLRVLGRRGDGYHEIESLVAFADIGDQLILWPDEMLELTADGPTAADAGPSSDNLVLKAARALAARVPGLRLGRFQLQKQLPVAAGLGGGSADAAAALRLLARANRLAPDDPRLFVAAAATGADVPVCLDPRPRQMRGIGEVLSEPLDLPDLAVVLVNPRVAVATKDVFTALSDGRQFGSRPARHPDAMPRDRRALIERLAASGNDLEPPAIALRPEIGTVRAAIQLLSGCRMARMSGSGATCFGLFDHAGAAEAAARQLQRERPSWWVKASRLGGHTAGNTHSDEPPAPR